jgi:hypothetical protein
MEDNDMTGRVLASDEARSAISQMQTILSSNFEGITDLNNLGQTLSEPNVWDGNLASDFRNNIWPSCHTALTNALTQLQELQTKLNTIQGNIMTAGGNS